MTTYGEEPADRPEREPDRTRPEPAGQPEPTPGYPGYPGGEQPGYPPQGPPPGYPPPGPPQGPPPGYPPSSSPPGYPPAQQPGYPPPGYPQQPGGQPPRPGYGQPPSGYPGQYPPAGGYGAPPPAYPGYGAPPGAPGGSVYDTSDPLVPGMRVGLNGWYERVVAAMRRSWREVLTILAITVLIPSAVLAVLGSASEVSSATDGGAVNVDLVTGLSIGVGFASVLVAIASVYLWAAGAAASTYTLTHQALGETVAVGDALRYGFRRAAGMWGWLLLSGLIVIGGLILCIVPGLYFIVALSLVVPVAVFERTNPISRSFKLVNANFGSAIGRVALIGVAAFFYELVLGCAAGLIRAAVSGAGAGVRWGTSVVTQLIVSALGLPASMLIITGVVVLYAELRNREAPVSTPQLAAEAR